MEETQKSTAFKGSILHFLSDPDLSHSGESYEYFDDGLMIVENGHVYSIGPRSELEKTLDPGMSVVDYGGKLILPGFIDTHVHYPQTDIIASYGKQLLDWLEKYTFPAEGKLKDTRYAEEVAEFFIKELLRNGTTTANTMCSVHKESAEIFFRKSAERNLRMISGKMMMDRNAPDFLKDTPEKGFEESQELIERWHGNNRLLYAVTPRFAVTSSDDQLRKSAELFNSRSDLYLHTHLAENEDEIASVKRLFPGIGSYLDVYDNYGLVGERSIFAHSIHLLDNCFEKMGKKKASISFCPTSNLFIGSGLFDMDKSRQNNIKVGMGTDIGGGTSFSMLRTLAEGYKVLQLKRQTMSPLKAFYLATLGGAESLALEEKIGNFKTGKEADFIVLNDNATPLMERRMTAVSDISERLFILMTLGDDRSVDATYIMGENAYTRERRKR